MVNCPVEETIRMEFHGSVDANTTNVGDNTKHDLLLMKGSGIRGPKAAILIEVDESHHFSKAYWLDDRAKEAVFEKQYRTIDRFILRIKVSENDLANRCVFKDGATGTIRYRDYEKFNRNLALVKRYIFDAFGSERIVTIDFANEEGIQKKKIDSRFGLSL